MTIKEFFSFKTNKYFWVNLLGMAIAVIAIVFITLKSLDIYTRHGEAVEVPAVVGMDIAEAAMLLRERGLSYEISDSTYVKAKPAGSILDVNPPSGQKVKEGRVIYITINTLDVPLRPIPAVADNSSLRQAEAKILSAGFKLSEPEFITGEKDWVYGVRYKGLGLRPGDKAPLGATLTLVVGDGLEESVQVDSTEVSEKDMEVGTESKTEGETWF